MNEFPANDAALRQNFLMVNSQATCMNRRAFLIGLGLGGVDLLLSPHPLRSTFERGAKELLYCIGSFGEGDAGTLYLLHIQREKPRVLYTVPATRPSAIVRHPLRSLLYVANDVSHYQHRPRGTVETFAVDETTGALEFVGEQPLSLSATQPRSLAVSSDGRSLLVAAFGGGAYNVLPISDSGLPGAPSTILKQVGRGEHPTEQAGAHPSYVQFHPEAGFAVAADYGADRLDILTADCDESDARKMSISARVSCASGSGPSRVAIHRGGELFFVAHVLRPALAAFHISPERKIGFTASTSLSSSPTAICFHPEHDVLYSAHSCSTHRVSLYAWHVVPQKGTLECIGEVPIPVGEVTAIHATNLTLWLASNRGLIAADLDRAGEPRKAHSVLSIPNIRSIAVL